MRNIALFLTYLGTDYHGWQVQKNLPTVAETMEKAAAMVVGHPVHMTGCGRTDAQCPGSLPGAFRMRGIGGTKTFSIHEKYRICLPGS